MKNSAKHNMPWLAGGHGPPFVATTCSCCGVSVSSAGKSWTNGCSDPNCTAPPISQNPRAHRSSDLYDSGKASPRSCSNFATSSAVAGGSTCSKSRLAANRANRGNNLATASSMVRFQVAELSIYAEYKSTYQETCSAYRGKIHQVAAALLHIPELQVRGNS